MDINITRLHCYKGAGVGGGSWDKTYEILTSVNRSSRREEHTCLHCLTDANNIWRIGICRHWYTGKEMMRYMYQRLQSALLCWCRDVSEHDKKVLSYCWECSLKGTTVKAGRPIIDNFWIELTAICRSNLATLDDNWIFYGFPQRMNHTRWSLTILHSISGFLPADILITKSCSHSGTWFWLSFFSFESLSQRRYKVLLMHSRLEFTHQLYTFTH